MDAEAKGDKVFPTSMFPYLLGFINLPTLDNFFLGDGVATTTEHATSSLIAYSSGFFAETWGLLLALAGLIIGAIFVRYFFKGILNSVKTLTGGQGGRRGRGFRRFFRR